MNIGNEIYSAGTAASSVTKELTTEKPSLVIFDHCASYSVSVNGTDINCKVIKTQGVYDRNIALAILPKGDIIISFKGTAQTGAGCSVFELNNA